ncbi:hypothetical protein N8D56_25075 (plasmid) [Devosia sp. A8/3-2]|nr:hypothetical protein N8D56_25075 [Devosia sp. A8/3-2]
MTTLATLADILANTPYWVWLISAVSVWRGLSRTQPREVGIGGLTLMPIVLVGLSLHNLLGDGLTSAILAGTGMGGLLGLAAGFQLESQFVPQKLDNGRLRLPGEWTSLIMALVIFGTRYIKIVTGIVNPTTAHADAFRGGMAIISAFFLTMLLTRTVLRLRMALA